MSHSEQNDDPKQPDEDAEAAKEHPTPPPADDAMPAHDPLGGLAHEAPELPERETPPEISKEEIERAVWDSWQEDPMAAPPLPLEEQIAAHLATLQKGEPGPCRKAIDALIAIGAPAVPALKAAAEGDDPDVAFDARKALEQIEA